MITTGNAEVFTEEKKEIKYTLTTEKPINYEMTFTSPRDEKCAFGIKVYNEDDDVVMNAVHSMKKSQQIFNLPVKAGTYYLKLFVADHIHSCNDKPFDFKLTKYTGNYEQEDNNALSTATPLIELKYYYGYLQTYNQYGDSRTDIDYYKIVLPSKSILDFEFLHNKIIDVRGGFKIELLDSQNNLIHRYEASLKKKKTESFFGLDKGIYFIKVSPDGGYTRHLEYKIAYATSENNNIEVMPNDELSNATLIQDSVYVSGNFNTYNSDYYKYKAKKGKYVLVFEHKQFKHDMTVSISNSDDEPIEDFYPSGREEKKEFHFEVKEDNIIYIKFFYPFSSKESDGEKYKFGIIKL